VAESLRFAKSGVLSTQRAKYGSKPNTLFCDSVPCLNVTMTNAESPSRFVERGGYDEDVNQDGELEWEGYFKPQYIHPPLHFIPLSDAIPQKIRDSLASSFGLIWASPSAAANQVRIAIEDLLTELRIPRSKRD